MNIGGLSNFIAYLPFRSIVPMYLSYCLSVTSNTSEMGFDAGRVERYLNLSRFSR